MPERGGGHRCYRYMVIEESPHPHQGTDRILRTYSYSVREFEHLK